MRSAVQRGLAGSPRGLLAAKRLFTDAERRQLAEALAATNATANLLGRSRIRLRQQRAEEVRGATKFSDEPTRFEVFDDVGALKPLAPEKAVEYFRGLVPRLNIDSVAFGAAMRKEAFTLAVATDQLLLEKVQGLLANVLETGQGASVGPKQVNTLLEQAGVTPKNPQYGEMVFRTNMKNALNEGADAERQDPDVIATFPVWLYVGIDDGRERPEHRVHFDRYFPAEITFAEVRDSVAGKFDGFNCRCDQIPIDKWQWKKLYAAGARIAAGYRDVVPMAA